MSGWRHAAARPVIVPETIVCDHGKAYLSATFRAACRSLGISLAPAHPRTPTDKPVIERTLGSVATLFAQHVAGYVGPSVERRGTNAEQTAAWSMAELQALLDEWIDEIHNLNHGTPAGEDLSDHLKYFTEHLPATFAFSELANGRADLLEESGIS